ncbi:MAG: VWA domain-containing protein [Gemmataceae bacterium]|nr:VWA domain-containing protein [Gemmataceae bacterium]
MPGFADPAFLWLLPLAPALAWWWAVRRRPALRYPSLDLVAGLPGGRGRRAKWGGAVLRGLALAALIVAAAGPRTPDLRTRLPAEGVAIVLVLDISGSMAERDVLWSAGPPPEVVSRLAAAKRAFRLFVAGGTAPDGTQLEPRPADPIGLVTFAVLPQTVCPPTLNHSVLLKLADEQEPVSDLRAGTNLGDAIAEGVLRLDQGGGNRKKVLVVLSDGEHNVSKQGGADPLAPVRAAALAAALGIKVYTIDAGGRPAGDAGDDAVRQREAGRETLRAVAATTGGRAFEATGGADLLAAYREIAELEKAPTVSFQYRRYHEYYPWAAAAAAGLLLAGHLLDRTRWRVVP